MLLVYAARHFRELSNQNELRPQDVMRILVHVHAYGDPARVPDLVDRHSRRIRQQIDARETDEVERLEAEYADWVDRLGSLTAQLTKDTAALARLAAGAIRDKAQTALARLEIQRDRAAAKLAERDEKIAEARRRAEDDRRDVAAVGAELGAIYSDPDELLKHARVVGIDEIEENEFNLNIPRYVDTFEPEARIGVAEAILQLQLSEKSLRDAEATLYRLLEGVGYDLKA